MASLTIYPDLVLETGMRYTESQLHNVLGNNKNYADYTGITPVGDKIGGTLRFPMLSLPDDAVISYITATIIAKSSDKNRVSFSGVQAKNAEGVILDKTNFKALDKKNTTVTLTFTQAEIAQLPSNFLKDTSLGWVFIFESLYGNGSFTTRWQKAYLTIVYTSWTPPKIDDYILTMHSV